jgi:hypothetical protein
MAVRQEANRQGEGGREGKTTVESTINK